MHNDIITQAKESLNNFSIHIQKIIKQFNPNVENLGLGCSTLSLSVHVTRWVDGWNDATKIGLELIWKCFWEDL